MSGSNWSQPQTLREFIAKLLEGHTSIWPPSTPGNYGVGLRPWKERPTDEPLLYSGGSTNLLNRIGDLLRDILGCYGSVIGGPGWVGRHSGAQHIRQWCLEQGFPLGDLRITWAPSTDICPWCVEAHMLKADKPSLSRQRGRRKCCCH